MRDLRRLLAAYACASLAIGLPWPLLLVLVWEQYGDGPHGALAVGLTGAARMAPYVLVSWAVGSLGDHVRCDRLVRATIGLRLVFVALAALAVASQHVGVGVVCAALAVLSATPTYPAVAASLPELAGPDRERATDLLVTIEVSAWVIGPALGGVLLADSMRPWTLLVAVVLAAVGLLLASGVTLPNPVEAAPDAVTGMLRHLLGCRPALAALAVAGVLNVVDAAAGVVLLPLSKDGWAYDDGAFGVATACLGFGALGAPVLTRMVTATVPRGLAVTGAALGLVALTPAPWPALPLLVLAGATSVVVESLLTGTLQDVVPDRYRAGAVGVADTVMVAGCLAGSVVAPQLVRLAGARPALLLVGLFAVGPVLVALGRPARREGTPYDAAGERAAAGSDPRSAPAVGAARVG